MSSEGTAPFEVWRGVPGRGADGANADEPTYYDRPVLKEPVWIWAVPAYFFVGGVAGAAAVLGAVAQLADRRGLGRLVRRCRRLAAAGSAAGTALLIYDLGRPERFLNMLRVFRRTSPLSVGSWVLAAAGPLCVGSAALSECGGALRGLGDGAGLAAGALGMPLAGYTAVLLNTTAVPVWQEPRRSLPPLFVASAVSGAASMLELLDLDEREGRIVRRFAVAGKAAELALAAAVDREASRVEGVGAPLRAGPSGTLLKAAGAATAGSLLLSLASRRSRAGRAAAGVLGVFGAAAVKFGIFQAGKASARDPRATFRLQRAATAAR